MAQANKPHIDAPETLYRLRLSVLKDGVGAKDSPSKIFVFPTLPLLASAASLVRSKFGSGLSAYKISESGVGAEGEDDGEDVEDGRTLALVVRYEDESADESWAEFKTRIAGLEQEEDWVSDFGA